MEKKQAKLNGKFLPSNSVECLGCNGPWRDGWVTQGLSHWPLFWALSSRSRGCFSSCHPLVCDCLCVCVCVWLSNAVGPGTGRYLTQCLWEKRSSCPWSNLGDMAVRIVSWCVFIYVVIAGWPCGQRSYIYGHFQASADRIPKTSTALTAIHSFLVRAFAAQTEFKLWLTCFGIFFS